MKQAWRLVKRAGPNTVGTIHGVIRPKIQTRHGIDVSCHHALPVGNIMRHIRRLPKYNTFAGTSIGTFFTYQAKIPFGRL